MKIKVTRKGDTRTFMDIKSLVMTKAGIEFGECGSIKYRERSEDGYVGSGYVKLDKPYTIDLDSCEKIEVFEEVDAE